MAGGLLRAALLGALAASAAGVAVDGREKALRQGGRRSFVQSMEFKQVLRICNAYPFSSALDISMNSDEALTDYPLQYTHCADFKPELHPGDRVEFKVGGSSVGTFTISALPAGDAVLMLVIYRHDTVTTAVSFESHVFAAARAPQLAVLDLYKGPQKSEMRIQDKVTKDADGNVTTPRSELLRYDSVLAVDPGAYEVTLANVPGGKHVLTEPLVALPGEAYVVIRCGVAAEEGASYPEDVIVFPKSPESKLGGAPRRAPAALLALAAAAATWLQG